MATSINIGGGDDKFNRYKMPPVMGKVEGRGNGIKTRIVNCAQVAKALHRPPGYVCKFFGCELGAQTKINDEEDIYIVNGSFNQAKLSETLELFIKMFVLCENCKLPETDLKVKKNGDIWQCCNACGHEGICDMTHKLCTYIGNNPPGGKKAKGGKKSKADRRARKAAAKAETTNGKSKKSSKRDEEGEILPMGAEFDVAAAVDAANERNANNVASTVGSTGGGQFSMMMDAGDMYGEDDGDDDGVEWSVDTSKEAQEERLRDLGVNLSMLEREEQDEERQIALKLRDYIDQGKKASKVVSKAEKLFGEDRAIHGIMSAVVVNEALGAIPKSIVDRAVPNLSQFGTPMDQDSQTEALDWLDKFGGKEDVRKVLPHILKKLYDGELLEEEVVFKWYRKPDGSKDVREAVKMIIDWLEKAAEESEEEDDEDDDE